MVMIPVPLALFEVKLSPVKLLKFTSIVKFVLLESVTAPNAVAEMALFCVLKSPPLVVNPAIELNVPLFNVNVPLSKLTVFVEIFAFAVVSPAIYVVPPVPETALESVPPVKTNLLVFVTVLPKLPAAAYNTPAFEIVLAMLLFAVIYAPD